MMNCMGTGTGSLTIGGLRLADWAMALTGTLLVLLAVIALVVAIRIIAIAVIAAFRIAAIGLQRGVRLLRGSSFRPPHEEFRYGLGKSKEADPA